MTTVGQQPSHAAVTEFESEAESLQSNSLSGNITVTVTEVLPNGLLVLRGEKWLRLNQGDEYIRLTGLAREEDVSSDNSIVSTKLADARISYSGTGALASSNRQGWASRFSTACCGPFRISRIWTRSVSPLVLPRFSVC